MGHYNVVVEDDKDAIWEEDDIGKVTHILQVCFIGYSWFKFYSNYVYENDYEQMVASVIPPSFISTLSL